MKKVTRMKEIAIELGVSLNTVSRALRDCYDISDQMKEKVRQKAIEMGYMPNVIYQSIKNNSNKIVAIVISKFKNFYSTCMCDKLIRYLSMENLDFTILCANGDVLKENLIQQCISQKIDGIISFVTPTASSFDLAILNNIKFVFVGSDFVSSKMNQIMCDNSKIAKLAAEYLLSKDDFDSYIFIGNDGGLSYLRFEAFKNTLQTKKPNSKIELLDWDIDRDVLIKRLTSNEKVGCFAYNDEIVYEVIDVLYNNPKFDIEKISFIGVDAIANHMHGLLKIPSIDRNYEKICETSVKIIKECFENEKVPAKKITTGLKLFDPNKKKGGK